MFEEPYWWECITVYLSTNSAQLLSKPILLIKNRGDQSEVFIAK